MAKVVYARESNLSAEELGDVFARSGIIRPARDIERLRRMVKNANLILTARVEGKLVGVARALTDFAWVCFVSDLAVDRECQRSGIGRELLRQMRELVGDEVSVSLFAGPGAETYYPHIGFESGSGWRVPRSR
jgi:ribosomal protein S18 acetylase RimI-like enzyme